MLPDPQTTTLLISEPRQGPFFLDDRIIYYISQYLRKAHSNLNTPLLWNEHL